MLGQVIRLTVVNIHKMQEHRHNKRSDRFLQHAFNQHFQNRNDIVPTITSLHFIDGINQVWDDGE